MKKNAGKYILIGARKKILLKSLLMLLLCFYSVVGKDRYTEERRKLGLKGKKEEKREIKLRAGATTRSSKPQTSLFHLY